MASEQSRHIPQLALRPEQAARALGVSRSFFFAEILPELRVVRCGRLRLVPLRSLEDWLEQHAARTLD
jgi:excisionase family DNA binding protein